MQTQLAEDDVKKARRLYQVYQGLCREIGKRIVGQAEVLEQMLIAIFCNAHCHLVGVPGPDESDGGPPHAARYITRDCNRYRLPSMELQRLVYAPDAFRAYLEGALT